MSKQEKLTNIVAYIVSALDQMQEEEAREQLSTLTTFDTRLDRLEEKVEGIYLDDITRDLRHFEERLDGLEDEYSIPKRRLDKFEERLDEFETSDDSAAKDAVRDHLSGFDHDEYDECVGKIVGLEERIVALEEGKTRIGEGNFALLERIEALEDQAEENARHVNEARRARDAERLLALEERAERPMANAAIRVLIREELISIIRRLLPDEDEKI